MRKFYQWRTASEIISGGFPGEEIGVLPPDTGWRDATETSGSITVDCFYRDSPNQSNANSSRVVINITDNWTASIDQNNELTVTITTTVNSIVRDGIRGNPGSTVKMNLFIRREAGGPVLWSLSNDPIYTAHTILSTPVNLGTYTFTLAPGQSASRGSIYFRNNYVGHDDDPVPGLYVDELWVGTHFKNPLPKDYRPGATLKADDEYFPAANGIWVSHNDVNGGCHILSDVDNMTWEEMRTSAGIGNPPSILTIDDNPNSWQNQQELGKFIRT